MAKSDTVPVASADSSADGNEQTMPPAVFSCPQDGCVRVFQRLFSLEKHISLEKCTKSLENYSLLDLAKIGYKDKLEQGVGTVPTMQSMLTPEAGIIPSKAKEGWALKASKKYYPFNEKRKKYLDSKFEIGQTTGRKLNGDLVAKQMRRAHETDGTRLFKVCEFLTPQQINSYFSRKAAKSKQQVVDECDVQASEDENNFDRARKQALSSMQLEHPIVYDQYDISSMVARNTLKQMKVGMLQKICTGLELGVPEKPIRKKAPYLALLDEVVRQCSCNAE